MRTRINVNVTPAIARRAKPYTETGGCLLATACSHLGADVSVGYDVVKIDGRPYKISCQNAYRIYAAYYSRDGKTPRKAPFVKKSFVVTLTPAP